MKTQSKCLGFDSLGAWPCRTWGPHIAVLLPIRAILPVTVAWSTANRSTLNINRTLLPLWMYWCIGICGIGTVLQYRYQSVITALKLHIICCKLFCKSVIGCSMIKTEKWLTFNTKLSGVGCDLSLMRTLKIIYQNHTSVGSNFIIDWLSLLVLVVVLVLA